MNYTTFWHKLSTIYDEGEARAIARYVLEEQFGMQTADIYCNTELPADRQQELDVIIQRLITHEPVQYVLGMEFFCGRCFSVEQGVLIPRPETEELVRFISTRKGSLNILDIGTGSGCIAISLALENPEYNVTAWDISADALKIAIRNASLLDAKVNFEHQDALCPPNDSDRWDIIVSNPPYICNKERVAMSDNVLRYEPHVALFVPDEDPLLFYRAITGYARKALKPGGELFFEINPLYVEDMVQMAKKEGFDNVETITDQYGKKRFMYVK